MRGWVKKGQVHAILSDRLPLAENIIQALAVGKPVAGEICWNGYGRGKDWLGRIGYVTRKNMLFSKLTIREHLLRSIRLRSWENCSEKERKERVQEMLDFSQFNDIADMQIQKKGQCILKEAERNILIISIGLYCILIIMT